MNRQEFIFIFKGKVGQQTRETYILDTRILPGILTPFHFLTVDGPEQAHEWVAHHHRYFSQHLLEVGAFQVEVQSGAEVETAAGVVALHSDRCYPNLGY